MKLKTSELTGAALDRAVAKAEGRALREPRRGTNAEAASKQVPFTMFEPVATHRPDGSVSYRVETITVTRFGNLPGCSAPSISFVDGAGRKAQGSVDLFYFDRAEAELDCHGSEHGWLDGFEPSTDWAQGGPIIERERISVIHHDNDWRATNGDGVTEEAYSFAKYVEVPDPRGLPWRKWVLAPGLADVYGPTPLIAAMRCFVASKLGDEVDVPEELL